MTQSTPNLNLTKPGGGSTGTNTPPDRVDIDVLNDNFDKIDAAVGDPDEQNRQWYGPAAQIGTLPDAPKDGDTYQESDGNKILWKRTGGIWVTNETGLLRVRPGTVKNSGGAAHPNFVIDPDGSSRCTVAGDPSRVNIDGLFDFTKFKNYRMEMSIKKAAVSALTSLVLRASGADVGASTYYGNAISAAGSGSVTNGFFNALTSFPNSVMDAVGTLVSVTMDFRAAGDGTALHLLGQIGSISGSFEGKSVTAACETTANNVTGIGISFGQSIAVGSRIKFYAYT